LWWDEVKDDKWYDEMKRSLNHNIRKINQEIDIVFLGSTLSIFTDDVIMKMEKSKYKIEYELPSGYKMGIVNDLDPENVFTIGVDIANSTSDTADFSAIVIWDCSNDYQLGEYRYRVPSLKTLGRDVVGTVHMLLDLGVSLDNIFIAPERNSLGLGVIEELQYYYDERTNMYFEKLLLETYLSSGKMIYGVNTNAQTRPLIVNHLITKINHNPSCIKGEYLINECNTLVDYNGKIQAQKKFHDDVFMATGLSTYARKQLIKDGVIDVSGNDVPRLQRIEHNKIAPYLTFKRGGDRKSEVEEILDMNYQKTLDYTVEYDNDTHKFSVQGIDEDDYLFKVF
jgi:hypothetical protein